MKNNRKGFTITELVIVIAVIAILAAVLIPTFSSIVKKAHDSSDLQTARNIMIEYVAQQNATVPTNYFVKVDADTFYEVTNGKLSETPVASVAAGKTVVSKSGETITAETQS